MKNATQISRPRNRLMPPKPGWPMGVGGFTMIEVMAALALVGIVSAGLAMNSIAVVRYNRVSSAYSAATELAQDEMEQLRALDPVLASDPTHNPHDLTAGPHSDSSNPLTALGVGGGVFTRQWNVAPDSPVAGISMVVVTVSWTDGSGRSVQLTTYICQTGGCT